jgi:hypothetical protein
MRLLAILLLALVPTLARAEGEGQVWEALFTQYRPAEGGFSGWADFHIRRGSTNIMILRPAVGWGFGKHLTLHAGYAYIHTFIEGADDAHENRLWQQALYNHTVSDELKVQGRFRFEERFIDGDDATGYRIRMLARAQYAPRPNMVQLVIIDELFVHLNTTMKVKSGFNQNRAFFGLGADTKVKGLRVEGGYQNIRFGSANMDKIDHAFVMNAIAVIQ